MSRGGVDGVGSATLRSSAASFTLSLGLGRSSFINTLSPRQQHASFMLFSK